MAIGDVYQLGVNQQLYGVQLANIYHFEQLADTTPPNTPENSLINAWQEHLVPLQAAMSIIPWSNVCLTARRVRPTGGVRFSEADTTPGVVMGQGLSASTCCFASIYANPPGKRARSRHWYSGIPITAAHEGLLTAGGLTLFRAFLARLILTIKWVADNATFIIRVISTVDAVIRAVEKADARTNILKLTNRNQEIC